MGILGVKPAPVDGLPADAPRGREAERILAGELLQSFRDFQQTMTVFIERIAGRITNHVLQVGTRTFDTTGMIGLSWGAPCGCIEVQALGSNPVTVAAGPPMGTAPTGGTGVYIVPAGAVRLVNVASREVTLYGTEADQVTFQAFTFGGVSSAELAAVVG